MSAHVPVRSTSATLRSTWSSTLLGLVYHLLNNMDDKYFWTHESVTKIEDFLKKVRWLVSLYIQQLILDPTINHHQ